MKFSTTKVQTARPGSEGVVPSGWDRTSPVLVFPGEQILHPRRELADHLPVHGVVPAARVRHIVLSGLAGFAERTGERLAPSLGSRNIRDPPGTKRKRTPQQTGCQLHDHTSVVPGQGQPQVLALQDVRGELPGHGICVSMELQRAALIIGDNKEIRDLLYAVLQQSAF